MFLVFFGRTEEESRLELETFCILDEVRALSVWYTLELAGFYAEARF